jgi:hypothetical protein
MNIILWLQYILKIRVPRFSWSLPRRRRVAARFSAPRALHRPPGGPRTASRGRPKAETRGDGLMEFSVYIYNTYIIYDYNIHIYDYSIL